MSKWAIDIGTTNSAIARWNSQENIPEMVHLPGICREPVQEQEIEVRYSVPSCVYLLPHTGLLNKIGSWPLVQRHFFLGRQGLIGRQALEKDNRPYSHHFVPCFKPYLIKESGRQLVKQNHKVYSARKIATIFLRELLAHTQKATGERPRDVTFSVPVDSYEPYRAQLKIMASHLGIKRFKVIDEPVAAAIGYGLRVDEPKAVLVIDFGGGTLDIALVRLEEKISEKGRCKIIAKLGAPIGGNLVDAWLADEFCKRLSYNIQRHSTDPNILWWYRAMLEEACRVKESLFFKPVETFYMCPPKEFIRFEARLKASKENLEKPVDFSREEFVALLNKNGLYRELGRMIEAVLANAQKKGIRETMIQEVLMVGGSTLLPEVYPLVEKRFGRDKISAWQPFDAVAYGACAFAADHLTEADFIVHDYAFVTYNKKTHKAEYNIIVPRGTPFPTRDDFWRRQLTPTCSLGLPEKYFKLEICEIGKKHSVEQEFVWDHLGQLHMFKNGDNDQALIIPLNKENPVLGYLSPAHEPSDNSARLDISFMVDENRWLCVTVYDIKTRKRLNQNTPVLRLK
jgi:molecular chaperone DnaK